MVEIYVRPKVAGRERRAAPVYFTRAELNRLLSVYSRRVIRGEWRDYAIAHTNQKAVFSIFRHSYDTPLFRISKQRSGPQGSGVFQLHRGPCKVKQSRSLDDVLEVFDRQLSLVN